jgi:iron(III) transport system permease protein
MRSSQDVNAGSGPATTARTGAPPRAPDGGEPAAAPYRWRLRGPTLGRYSVSVVVLAVLLGLVGLPTVYVVLDAVARDPLDLAGGFSFSALTAVYTSGQVLTSLWQTIVVSVLVGALAAAFGAVIAWVLTRVEIRGASLLESVVVVPLFLSPLVGTIAWQALASKRSGILNHLLAQAHVPGLFRLNVDSIWGIVFVLTINYVPYGYLFCSGVLRNVDSSLEEASYMCGRGVLETTRRVLVPLLRSGLLSSLLFISILAAGEFSVPSILGASSSYTPLSVQVYNAVYHYPQDYPRAGAISTMMILISLVALFFYRRSIRDGSRFVTVTGRGFGVRRMRPGRWRTPIAAFLGLYIFVAIVLPYASLLLIVFTKYRTGDLSELHFTMRNIHDVLKAADVRSAIWNTLEVSVAVPVACVLIGLVVVYCADRLRMPGGRAANYIATAPLAISGIVFGTGVLIAYIRTTLYATIGIIALALIAHYVSHAVRIVGNGFGQLDASLEEAARMSGATRPRVLRTIAAPLLRPSLISAFLLIYVFTVREVNTTIILYSPTSLVLSVLAWNYLADGTFAQAAVVGVIQTMLMVAGIIIARFIFGIRAGRSAV